MCASIFGSEFDSALKVKISWLPPVKKLKWPGAEGQFSEEHFTHVLSLGEEDYDDYTEQDVEEFPELDYSDEQLAEAVSKLNKKEYKQYISLRDQYLQQYRIAGRIRTFSDLVRDSLQMRFPGIPGADAKAVLELRDKLEFEFKQKRKEGEMLKDKGETVTEVL